MKTIVITGSVSGIGKEIALLFSKIGWRVIGSYHNQKPESQPGIEFLPLDLTDSKSIEFFCDQIKKLTSGVDILINNAGVFIRKRFLDQNLEEINGQLDTNLKGMIELTWHLLPIVKETVINVSSVLGINPKDNAAVYCATKFGVRGFTKSLALDYPDINFYSFCPSLTATAMGGRKGDEPKDVANIVLDVIMSKIKVESGGDIDARKIIRDSKSML